MSEYLSFDDVLRQLGISEDELRRLVSEGELRAFRDQDQMRFRKEDVDSFSAGKPPDGPGVVLPGQEKPSEGGEGFVLPGMESVVDFGGDVEAAPSDTSVPVVDFGEEEESKSASEGAPPLDVTGVPTADFGDTDATIIQPSAEEEEPSEEADTTGVTQEMVFEESEDLDVHKEDSSSVGAAEVEETFAEEGSSAAAEEEAVEAPEGGTEGAAAVEEEVAEEPAARAQAVAAAPAVPGHHPIMSVCLLLTGIIMWALGGILVDLVRVTLSEAPTPPAGSSQSIMKLVVPAGDKAAR